MICRRIKWGELVEGVEIVPKDEQSKPIASDDIFSGECIKVHFIKKEEETLFYDVKVPKNFRVKPPDLRRFAYDHKKVESLVANCVKDNFVKYVFEPVNESTLRKLQSELFVALQDLSSVLDLLSVECYAESSLGAISVNVKFEHKNGELKTLVVALYSDVV